MAGRMEFGFQFGKAGAWQGARPADGTPFRILVLADLRGGAGAPSDARVTRTTAVDVDNFEAIFERYSPTLELPGGTGEGTSAVVFRSLDDFHPDALHQRLEIFGALRTMRAELNDPATFAAALARLQPEAAGAAAPEAAPAVGESDGAAIERLLGRAPGAARGTGAVDITGLLKQVVAPYVVAARDPRADAVIASVDAASEGLMRTILRSAAFRALESAWRGVHELVTSEACGEGVEVHVLDAPQARVATDLEANAQALERSALARAVLGDPAGSVNKRWALVVAAYSIGADEASLRMAAALGAIAHRAGGALIAHAQASLLGCAGFASAPSHAQWAALDADAAAAWGALRRSPDAAWIALASPRVLMRQPYGRKSDPTERFAFEEVPADHDADAMPWGHPGFALAQLLATSFQAAGFGMEPGDHRELDDRPAFTYVSEGEMQMAPCAEAFLSEATTSAMLERGVLAIASVRNRPALVVPRFQSIAEPPAALAGPWS